MTKVLVIVVCALVDPASAATSDGDDGADVGGGRLLLPLSVDVLDGKDGVKGTESEGLDWEFEEPEFEF